MHDKTDGAKRDHDVDVAHGVANGKRTEDAQDRNSHHENMSGHFQKLDNGGNGDKPENESQQDSEKERSEDRTDHLRIFGE